MISRRYVVPVLFTLAAFGTLVGLGSWQIERWGAKQRLIARVAERTTAAPVPPPVRTEWPGLKAKDQEYRRVTVAGRLLHDKELHLYSLWSPEGGRQAVQGWEVFTPLVAADGTTILINRGFVPDAKRAPSSRSEGLIRGEVSITGLLRMPEKPGTFAPPDRPEKREFFTRDPKAMAAAAGLQDAAPFVIAADAAPVPGGWPKGGVTRVSFPDNHLQYAATWFTLALAVLILFALWYRKTRRETAAVREAGDPAAD